MRVRSIHLFVTAVCLGAFGSLMLLDWDLSPFLSGQYPRSFDPLLNFLVLTALGLLSEALALTLVVGRVSGNASITFIPAMTCVLLFGPSAGVVFIAVSGVFGEFLVRHKPAIRATFNVAQWVLAAALGGLVFTLLGGRPLGFDLSDGFQPQFWPFLGFLVVFLSLNNFLVATAITLSQDLPFRRVWSTIIGSSSPDSLVYDFLVSPVSILLAFLYTELGLAGILLSLFALLFIRRSYLTNQQLERANRDLLKALVKAIETRDPYTSGHSMRVAALARRICDSMHLLGPKASAIETAALLHDVGKIESVYVDILRKPGSLSSAERKIIESHVEKGVELLRQLSSFPQEVLLSVKHHHERVDGLGYPDGLKGEAIPLGARIIKVCDSIDAMLSDRPYRCALPVSKVREQLVSHSGTQFDAEIVGSILRSTVLEDHEAEMDLQRQVSLSPERSVIPPRPREVS